MTNFSTKKCRLYAGCETFLKLIYVNKLSKTRRINGERAKGEMEVAVGDNISFSARMEEEDTKPDIGSESASHTVTKEDIMNGFSTSLEVVVTENGGRNKGKSAHFVVTYKFVPK